MKKVSFQKPSVGVALFTLCAFAVMVSLGTWQVQRLYWKTRLLDEIHARMERPAQPLPEKIDNPKGWEYRRVSLTGQFLHDNEFLIGPRTREGKAGYHMLTAFQRASGGVVFVNRGWISDEKMSEAVRPKGTQKIEGIVQLPHPTAFTPQNNPQKNLWYWADIDALNKSAKVNALPVIVNVAEKNTKSYPIGGKVEASIPNNHKQYAMFWFTMAGLLQLIFLIYHRRGGGK